MNSLKNSGLFNSRSGYFLVILGVVLAGLSAPVIAQAPMAKLQEQVASLKAEMASNKQALRQYEWIETTVISLNGEEKASTQKQCYYDANGEVQKVDMSPAPTEEHQRGIRGRIAEKKKAELSDYMKSAVALIKTYLPPDPAKLQAVKDAGDVSIHLLDNAQHVQLVFANYEKAGDALAIEVDRTSHKPTGISVATYLDGPSDAVNLGVVMSQLPDGTVYPSTTTLDASAKNLTVTTSNSGYKKKGG